MSPAAHQDAAYDVLRATDQAAIASFRRSARDAVAARRFSAIITDGPGQPLGDPPALSRYYQPVPAAAARRGPGRRCSVPVAGRQRPPRRTSGFPAAAVPAPGTPSASSTGPLRRVACVKIARAVPRSGVASVPGPFRRSFWRSPVRGPWLTSVFGLVLLASIPVMFATGLLSYAAYNPDLSPVNDETPGKGLLGFYLFSWPTHPDLALPAQPGRPRHPGAGAGAGPAVQAVVGAAEAVRVAPAALARARPGTAVAVPARRRGGVRVRDRAS